MTMGDWRIGRDGCDPLAELDASLADAELAAFEADFVRLLAKAYGASAALLECAEAGARVDPDQWPFLREQLDEQIAQLEGILRG